MEVYVLFALRGHSNIIEEDLLGVYHTKEDAELNYNGFLYNEECSSLYSDYSIKKVTVGSYARFDHSEV